MMEHLVVAQHRHVNVVPAVGCGVVDDDGHDAEAVADVVVLAVGDRRDPFPYVGL